MRSRFARAGGGRSLVVRVALVVALASAVATSCRKPEQAPQRTARPLPAGPAVVDVTMREYAFEYDGAIPAGRVVFRAHNAGRQEHHLELVPLSEEFPPIDEQLRGTTRRVILSTAGVRAREPGESGAFAADLAPGSRYGLVCFLKGADGQVNALKGMHSEFRTKALARSADVDIGHFPVSRLRLVTATW